MPNIESKTGQKEEQESRTAQKEEQTSRSNNQNEQRSRGQCMRERISKTVNRESAEGLDQIFEAKLAAVHAYENKLTSVTDPYARKVLQDMITQERRELMNITELADIVDQSPDMGRFTRTRRQMGHQLKMKTGHDTTFWLGAAALTVLLVPGLREQLRPLAVKTTQGIMGLSEQVQGLFSGVREDLEDIVSQAQFEKFKDSIDGAIEETIPDPNSGPIHE